MNVRMAVADQSIEMVARTCPSLASHIAGSASRRGKGVLTFSWFE
jgi:hypothetical protein